MSAQAKVSAEVLLGAGGLVPVDASLPAGAHSDVVSSRTYRHPALGERVVVRLPSKPLAPAEDLELDLLGFEAPRATADVARRRRRALGFPGWALVHQPKRAAVALGLVKELKKAAKLARSKPGHAKDAFDALGKRLGRSVPAFLPSFYEEAGRAFIEHGNVTYAAGMFAKAREAEKAHGLKIDPEARQTSFLEFALAGALSGKVLTQYGSELSATERPPIAYARFRELVVRRLLGGMPPWAGMGTELHRLVKAAKLDVAQEDAALLVEILDAPVLARAPAEFWTTYEPALVELCMTSNAAKAALLRLTPNVGYSEKGDKIARWLKLLDACGAIAALECPKASAPPEIAASIRPAEWLKRMVAASTGWRSTPSEELFAVLDRLASRLKEESEPLLLSTRWGWMDVDLLEEALSLGVAVGMPDKEPRLALDGWGKRAGTSPRFGRDLVHVAADARFRPPLIEAVGRAFGDAEFDAAARGKPVLSELRRAHLETLVSPIALGVPTFGQRLQALEKTTNAATFAEFPEAFEKLKALSVVPSLERTLKSGLAAELGWKEFDAAVGELGRLRASGIFPYLCLYNATHAVVLGPKGRILEHDFRAPPKHEIEGCYFVGGQLRVMLRGPKYERVSYWSASPGELHTFGGYWSAEQLLGIELSDGSLASGGRALSVGDTQAIPDRHAEVVSDGTTFWVWQYEGSNHVLFEIDPKTGKRGRRSAPTFFTQGLREGEAISRQGSALFPVPPELTTSPLGLKDGLSGVRWRAGKVERIDGLSVPSPESSVDAVATLPGGAVLLLSQNYRSTQVRVPHEEAATSADLAPWFWHYLVPRDLAGSEALRNIDVATCRKLLDGTPVAQLATDDDEDDFDDDAPMAPETPTPMLDRVAAALPAVTNVELRKGIAAVASRAAGFASRLQRHVEAVDPSQAGTTPALAGRSDEHLKRAIAGFCETEWNAALAFDQVQQAASALEGKRPHRLSESAVHWTELVGRAGALAFVATSPAFTADERESAADFLGLFASTPFLEADRFRRVGFEIENRSKLGAVTSRGYRGTAIFSVGDSTFIGQDRPDGFLGLEHSKSGAFRLPETATLTEEETIARSALSADRAKEFAAQALKRGARGFDRAPIELLSKETGLSLPESSLLWLGCPGFATREANFLEKSVREAMGLKMAEARLARETVQGVPQATRVDLLAEAVGDAPLELYDAPLAVAARLAAAWNRHFGKRQAVPTDVVEKASAELHGVLPAPSVLGAMIEPAGTAYGRDGWFKLEEDSLGFGPKPGEPNDVFTHEELTSAAAFIPWVFHSLPVGHPIRNGLPRFLDAVRIRLKNPELLVPLGSPSVEEPERKAILKALGDTATDEAAERIVDEGAVVATVRRHGYYKLYIRPSRWSSAHPHAPLLRSLRYWGSGDTLRSLDAITSDAFSRLAARVGETRLPSGAYEANPLSSASQVVKRAQKHHGLGEPAAQLYLQLLALPFPSTAAVLTYNGWSPGQHAEAAKELLKKKLVLEAKRERSGRDHFLPGAWEALKAPHRPIEAWKLPLLGATRVGEAIVWPTQHQLPLEPLHDLFERAWKRIEAGDVPRYEEVKA